MDSQDTTKKLNAYLQTILNDLKKASYEKKLDFWVLHELDEFLTESYRNTTEVSHFESGWSSTIKKISIIYNNNMQLKKICSIICGPGWGPTSCLTGLERKRAAAT